VDGGCGHSRVFSLDEITIDATGESGIFAAVAKVVSRIIEDTRSFVDILNHLDVNRFQIAAGVDCEQVSAFVAWVESAKQFAQWEQTQPP
jgi:hypothetical protein